MPRMRILSTAEQEQFETPPEFDSIQRKKFFDFPKALQEFSADLRKPSNRIGFLLSCGYFKATNRFFSPKDFHIRDIEYVARQVNLSEKYFSPQTYTKTTRLRHEHFILEFYGCKRFDKIAETVVIQEIAGMARAQQKPKLIFGRCIDLMIRDKVQMPSYHRLTELILSALNQRKHDLSTLIERRLMPDTRKLLDELFVQSTQALVGNETEDTAPSPPKTASYRLTLLKKLSQSTRPTKVRMRVDDLAELAELYTQLSPVLTAMNLYHEGIRYYAGSVLKSEIFQLKRRADEDRYVHVIAFIAHQYYRLQDNLVDVLLSVVKSFQNTAQREHKEQTYEQRKTSDRALSDLLSRLDDDVFSVLKKIRKLSDDNQFSDADKISQIQALLKNSKDTDLANLKSGLEEKLDDGHYYDILEARSVRLQNRVSPILKALNLQVEPSASTLKMAIEHFKDKAGAITKTAPLDFLDAQEREAVAPTTGEQKFRTSLYKTFLFMHVASAIKSGNLNLAQSYKYRPLDDYLISKDRWKREKEQLLKRAGLSEFADPKKVLKALDEALYQQYLTTNSNEGENPHLKITKNGTFKIATPALEGKNTEPLRQFFPKRHYVPLTEILSTVNLHTGFLGEFQHWQQRYNRTSTSYRALYAGVMGLGCGIGTRKMAQISSQVTESELEHAVNWHFSLDNIQTANDLILRFIDKLELPNIYRRLSDQMHTSSDGQKFEVHTDSLNANHSFKYFGKGQGISAYTFIDERNLLWHSLVFSAAERESAYVIDGLMRNDVVKSDIHSTDTHGYSEAIFAATHLLGFSYAPRIKNLKKQKLYIFKSRKNADQSSWKITPDNYINEKNIENNWDDFLRLITTIKLKKTTASDIFRRLNSYSKQHALYKTMKAFGQIIKSLFILRYLDEIELRQAIEKQLNKVELSNRFTRAVSVGNPRGYTQGDKESQEVAETCTRLIKNGIICWNYLYLEQKLAKAKTQEEREDMLAAVATHSVIAWAHINLLGEYDFSDEKLKDSVGILPPKITA